jgi:GT2 family glycosyltransferase
VFSTKPALLQLSVIIVNYNVKYFLEQCLHSLEKAIKNLQVEVWVVDNASTDDSVTFVQQNFPWVNIIANQTNVGFAKANNQALFKSSGDYILFLNPDTLLPEDCLINCYTFLQQHTDAGSLGIRMIDGSGKFLPESKRSFPSPVTSFFKLVGLNAMFPSSRVFGKYSLGYLDEHANHEVDVLAGAFIMAKREILLRLNGFDETFFMYGEDVDLSYRIQKSAYKNFYFSGSCIIHFKGESTKKGSLNYVRMFYNAMSIFVRKHYGGSKARLFNFFIQLAIVLRGAFSAVAHFLGRLGLPLFDALIIFGSFKLVNNIWIAFVRHGNNFIPKLVNISLPGFTLVFLIAATLAGIYDRKYKPAKAFYAALVATVVMLAVYSLLPEQYRFSRGVILFGGLMALLLITFSRWLLQKGGWVDDDDETTRHGQTLIVGAVDEFNEVKRLLTQASLAGRIMGRVAVNGKKEDAIASLDQLPVLSNSLDIREIIFCVGYLSYKSIIQHVQQLPAGIAVRFHAAGSVSIVGSDSKDTSGEYVSVEGSYALTQPYQKRMKRILDVSLALLILLTFPLQVIICGAACIKNAWLVLAGKRTWVGYSTSNLKLPSLVPGVLNTIGMPVTRSAKNATNNTQPIDDWYARQYDWTHDVKVVLKNYKRLGGNS